MKVTILGPITKAPSGVWQAPVLLLGSQSMRNLDANYDPNSTEPHKLDGGVFDGVFDDAACWAYRGISVLVKGADALSPEQVQIEVKHAVMRHDKRFDRLRREVEAFENLDRADVARRQRIPDTVRLFVWQRDQGRCVKCGVSEKLEFDHVIPIAKGGSNTERNIQLLCESCNRSKGVSI